jgi:hypothetical protein
MNSDGRYLVRITKQVLQMPTPPGRIFAVTYLLTVAQSRMLMILRRNLAVSVLLFQIGRMVSDKNF